jgi:hypothetical protein
MRSQRALVRKADLLPATRHFGPKTLQTDDEATSIVPKSLAEALSIPAVHTWYHWSTP